jgi:hypothetical protein
MKRLRILITLAAMLALPLASESTPILELYEDSVEGGKVLDFKMEVTAKKGSHGQWCRDHRSPMPGLRPIAPQGHAPEPGDPGRPGRPADADNVEDRIDRQDRRCVLCHRGQAAHADPVVLIRGSGRIER